MDAMNTKNISNDPEVVRTRIDLESAVRVCPSTPYSQCNVFGRAAYDRVRRALQTHKVSVRNAKRNPATGTGAQGKGAK